MEETVTISLARYNRLMAENEAAKGKFVQMSPYVDGHYFITTRDSIIEKLSNELYEARKENHLERNKVFELQMELHTMKEKKRWFI